MSGLHSKNTSNVFKQSFPEDTLELYTSGCEFLKSDVTYLIHMISQESIRTDPEKSEAIKNWPLPKTVMDFFLIHGVLKALHKGTKKDKAKIKPKKSPFVWNDCQQKAFETLKEKLKKPSVLAYADCRNELKFHMDAFSRGLGAVLYQHQDGQDRATSYASISFRPLEKFYPVHNFKFRSVRYRQLHNYLYGTNRQ